AGKSTTLRCVMGLHRQMSGTVRLGGRDLSGLAAHERARAGLGYVPDDRGIYASLTVEENLLLPPQVGPTRWPLERVFKAFPVLKERRRHPGTKLSGGEQQALSIALALRMGAAVVLLDVPNEGPVPVTLNDGKLVIGVINDQSLVYADLSGKNAVEAVKMAVEDFKAKYGENALGGPIEVITADHQNKPDLASSKAQEFYERNNAD